MNKTSNSKRLAQRRHPKFNNLFFPSEPRRNLIALRLNDPDFAKISANCASDTSSLDEIYSGRREEVIGQD